MIAGRWNCFLQVQESAEKFAAYFTKKALPEWLISLNKSWPAASVIIASGFEYPMA